MPKITINKNTCKSCLLCVSFCPKGHLVEGKTLNSLGVRPAAIKTDVECAGCMLCVLVCPDCCIEVYR